MKRTVFLALAMWLTAMSAAVHAQTAWQKMSPGARRLALQQSRGAKASQAQPTHGAGRRVCAFVRVADGDNGVFGASGAKPLAQFGDIFIADVPLDGIAALAADRRVNRIEIERGSRPTLDSIAFFTRSNPVHEGEGLPQAFTGRGVVMGVMDVGFDLTHPTFRDPATGACRISRFWDFLSTDTAGSHMYVGAEYVGAEAVEQYAHSRDAAKIYHGTHTLGIAAGNGCGTIYRGMAPESDICLVSNAVTDDVEYIDTADYYKYTYATDALGFKYIFDYAESVGRPCVISFSEGSEQDLRGDDILYYAVLERMTGPGRIIVSSAGNAGMRNTYMEKPSECGRAGSFLSAWGNTLAFTMKSAGTFTARIVLHTERGDTVDVPSRRVCEAADSVFTCTIDANGTSYALGVSAYPSCYDSRETVYDMTITGPDHIGRAVPLSLELLGTGAYVEMFHGNTTMGTNAADPSLCAAVPTHSINSPSSAPCVICAGGTACRPVYINADGEEVVSVWGESGKRGTYSSVGPTFDGRVKPEVMAPGANIISSMSSFYMDAQPGDSKNIIERFDYGGRTYGWLATGGTSMSSPAVGGIIALWLQANPSLSPDDIRGVLSRTCTPCGDYGATPNNYCGYGQIDAYAGLLDVLGLSSVRGISRNNPGEVNVRPIDGNRLSVQFSTAAQGDVPLEIYDTTGRIVAKHILTGGDTHYIIYTGALPGGIYAVQVNGAGTGTRGSVLIRK